MGAINRPLQDFRLPVGAQLHSVMGRKDLAVLSDTLPVASEEPVTGFAGMALARPGDKSLLQHLIVAAHGGCRDNAVVVGGPSHDQRIKFRDDPRLWCRLQLLQALLNSSQVTSH